MLEGMYTAAAGMAAQQQRLDALSNDLANVNTVGYKGLRVAFRDLVYSATGPGAVLAPGNVVGAGAATTVIGRSQADAALQSTGDKLDVAISGPGYLMVRRADGSNALTRNGQLTVDVQRRVCSGGLPLNPPVRIPVGVDEKDVAITPDGKLSAGGAVVGTLQLFSVASPDRMQSVGANLFTTNAASGGPVRAGANSTLQQGVLETSNVDMGNAMTEMMLAQRSYAMASKAIDMQNQMAQIANGVKK